MGEVLHHEIENPLTSFENPLVTATNASYDWSPYRLLQDPEEQTRLDGLQTLLEKQSLPGVSTERRFHRHHPDILVPNVLLRRHLREQFSQEGLYSAEYGVTGTSQITKGHAQGEQSRLHTAVAITSQFTPRRLYYALLGQRPVTVSSEDRSYGGNVYDINSASLNFHDFVGRIVSVRACTGEASSMFVVRTELGVHAIALHFVGSKRVAILELRTVLDLDNQVLQGTRPIAAFGSFSGTWRVCVATDDGLLRIWNTQTTSRKKPTSDDFQLASTIRLSKQSNFPHDIVFHSAKCPDDFLLVYEDRILSANLVSKTMQLIYEAQRHMRIKSLAMLSTKSEACLGCILTTDRVLLGDLSHGWRLLTSWKHHYDVSKRLNLQVFSSSSSVFIVVYLPALGLCTLYTAHVYRSTTSAQQVQRLTVDTKGTPTCVFPYHIFTNQQAVGQPVFGMLSIGSDNSITHTLYGGASTLVTSTKLHKLCGPAVVDEKVMLSTILHRSEEVTSIVDLQSWYHELMIRTDQLRIHNIKEMTPDMAALCYESLDLSNSDFAAFDTGLENFVAREQEKDVCASDVYGLRLYENDADAMDPECNTAHNLYRMFRAWRGARTVLNADIFANEKSNHMVYEKAAMSLAQAAIVLTTQVDGLPQLSNLTQTLPKINDRHTSTALNRLFDDWQVSSEPESYSWRPLQNRQAPLDLRSLTIQEIPAFKTIPPIVTSSQVNSAVGLGLAQDDIRSSQDAFQFAATQPVLGKFADRKVKRKKKAGF